MKNVLIFFYNKKYLIFNATFNPSSILFLLFATPLFANCKSEEQVGFRSYNFRIENDYFNNEDSNYTSGVILSGVTHDFKGDVKK